MKESLLIRIVLICLGLTLIGLAAAYFTPYSENAVQYYIVTLTIGQVVAIYVLMQNGRLIHSKYWSWIKGFLVLFLVGIIFKILHWDLANIIHMASVVLLGVTYTLFFLKKDNKSHLDILKVIWVFYASIGDLFVNVFFRDLYTNPIEHVLFWVVFADFIYLKQKSKQQLSS